MQWHEIMFALTLSRVFGIVDPHNYLVFLCATAKIELTTTHQSARIGYATIVSQLSKAVPQSGLVACDHGATNIRF